MILLQSILLCIEKRQQPAKDPGTPTMAKDGTKVEGESCSSPGSVVSAEKPKANPVGPKESQEKPLGDAANNDAVTTAKLQKIGSKEGVRKKVQKQPDVEVDTEDTIYERRSRTRGDSVRLSRKKSVRLDVEATQEGQNEEESSGDVRPTSDSRPTSPNVREKTDTMLLGEWIKEQATQVQHRTPASIRASPLKSTQRSTIKERPPQGSSYNNTPSAATPTQPPEKTPSLPRAQMSGEVSALRISRHWCVS
ncbi:hypothetical protein COOONC_12721 [Cooperia oncophora]